MGLKSSLCEIKSMYSTVKARQFGFNKRYHNDPITYKGGLDGLDDGYSFKFSKVILAEDVVEITFMSDADGEPDECVDWIPVNDFLKHFEDE